jgi:hypothetical protein
MKDALASNPPFLWAVLASSPVNAWKTCSKKRTISAPGSNQRAGYVNLQGELTIPAAFLWGRDFSEGVTAVNIGTGQAHRTIAEACEDGFIDCAGSFAIEPRYLAVGSFRDGLCLVETEAQLLYIDRKGDSVWSSDGVEGVAFDPYHLLPKESQVT